MTWGPKHTFLMFIFHRPTYSYCIVKSKMDVLFHTFNAKIMTSF